MKSERFANIYWIYWKNKYWEAFSLLHCVKGCKDSIDITPTNFIFVFCFICVLSQIDFTHFLDAIVSPSTYPCQLVGQSVSESFIVSDLEIAIASSRFASLLGAMGHQNHCWPLPSKIWKPSKNHWHQWLGFQKNIQWWWSHGNKTIENHWCQWWPDKKH